MHFFPFAGGVFFLPDSPKYLYIMRGDRDKAIEAVRFYHGESVDIEKVMAEYEAEKKLAVGNCSERGNILKCFQLSSSVSFKDIFTERHMRIPLLICLLVAPINVLCGINLGFIFSTCIKAVNES